MQALGVPFTEAVVQYCPEERLALKPTNSQKKKMHRAALRKCTRHVEAQIGENDALNILSENQSISSYKRIRLLQSFESPQAKQQRMQTNPLNTKGILPTHKSDMGQNQIENNSH